MKKRINQAKTSVKDFLKNFLRVLRRPDMVILPGNLSFCFVLAIVPSLGLISYAASVLNLSTDVLYDFIANSFSSEMADLILGVNLGNNAGIHFFVTLIVGFYIASNGADSIITSCNAIYGIPNKSWLKRRIKACGLTFFIVLLLIFMLIIPVFGNTIISLIHEVDINEILVRRIINVINLLKGPISWIIIFVIIRIIYLIAPDKKHKNRVINYGAVFTTVGWIITTKVFSIYVNRYAEYQALYGGFASIIVLMIWLNFLSYIFTIGIALNSQKDESNLLKTGTINVEN